ncbi:Hsp20/alpha crystallin family protein [Hydrogenibacillus schlegelii]|nr:Hsp20/alpha crystallin family protein [Hydrogenibacillus schlegelii]
MWDLIPWSSWWQALDRAFARAMPAVGTEEDGERFIIRVALPPGVPPEALTARVAGHAVTLQMQNTEIVERNDPVAPFQARRTRALAVSVPLPAAVDAASMDRTVDGRTVVLTFRKKAPHATL